MIAVTDKLYSRKFILLCLSSLLFMASFNMIIPELPSFLTSLGGAEYKGLIISLFALTAAFSRPFSGKLTDSLGRLPIMIFGALAAALCSALYPFITGLLGFFILRLLHGLSTGFKPTGDTAYLADVISDKRRGEALGILGVSGSIGMAGGPALGGYISNIWGTNTVFFCSSLTAFLSIAIILGMKETLEKKQKFSLDLLKINRHEILEKRVFPPSLVMLLCVFPFGILLTLVPDFSEHLGMENKGFFYTVMLLSSVAVRLFSGKASDKYGREALLRIGTFILFLAMIIISFATDRNIFLFGGIIYGIGNGIISPTIYAWTVDLALTEKRGKAIATMYISLEIGILLGAFLSGWVFGNNYSNFKYAFLLGAFTALSSFIFLIYRKRRILPVN